MTFTALVKVVVFSLPLFVTVLSPTPFESQMKFFSCFTM